MEILTGMLCLNIKVFRSSQTGSVCAEKRTSPREISPPGGEAFRPDSDSAQRICLVARNKT